MKHVDMQMMWPTAAMMTGTVRPGRLGTGDDGSAYRALDWREGTKVSLVETEALDALVEWIDVTRGALVRDDSALLVEAIGALAEIAGASVLPAAPPIHWRLNNGVAVCDERESGGCLTPDQGAITCPACQRAAALSGGDPGPVNVVRLYLVEAAVPMTPDTRCFVHRFLVSAATEAEAIDRARLDVGWNDRGKWSARVREMSVVRLAPEVR